MNPARQVLAWLLAGLLAALGLYLLRDILLPFVAGMAIAYLLDPIADRLEDWGCSRALATSLITAALFLILVAFILVLLPLLQDQVIGFIGRLPVYAENLRARLDWIVASLQAGVDPEDLERLRAAGAAYLGEAVAWIARMLAGLWSGGVALLNLLSLVFITPVVAFYLLRDWDRIVGRIDGWLPRPHAEVIREQFKEIDRRLAGFVRGQAVVAGILALLYAVGLSLVGLDFGLVIGLGAGAISFVPFLGAIAGFVVSMGVALFQFGDDWLRIALVAAIFIAGQALEGNFLTPRLVGQRIGLHPVWLIFGVLAGGVLLGFVGVLLAVPAAAAIGVVVRFGLDRYMHSALYLGAAPPAGDDDDG